MFWIGLDVDTHVGFETLLSIRPLP